MGTLSDALRGQVRVPLEVKLNSTVKNAVDRLMTF